MSEDTDPLKKLRHGSLTQQRIVLDPLGFLAKEKKRKKRERELAGGASWEGRPQKVMRGDAMQNDASEHFFFSSSFEWLPLFATQVGKQLMRDIFHW